AARERRAPPRNDAPRDGPRRGVPAVRRTRPRAALAPDRPPGGLRAAGVQRRPHRAPPPSHRPRHARAAAGAVLARRDAAAGAGAGTRAASRSAGVSGGGPPEGRGIGGSGHGAREWGARSRARVAARSVCRVYGGFVTGASGSASNHQRSGAVLGSRQQWLDLPEPPPTAPVRGSVPLDPGPAPPASSAGAGAAERGG